MSESRFVIDANESNFDQVLQHSHQALVVVDFWADWCQPCKTLMPLLAQIVDEYQGSVLMVKVNADENQNLTAQYGVRSLPTVKFFKAGQEVDSFMGVQPESTIRDMINKHRSRPTEPYRQQALMMAEQGDVTGAIELMRQVLQHEPDFHEAGLELAGMLLKNGEAPEAQTLLDSLPEDELDKAAVNDLKGQLKLVQMQEAANGTDTSALEQRLVDNADDYAAMLELAQARIAQGRSEEGLQLYLAVMQKAPEFEDGAGRKGLIETFELLGASNPLVKQYRRKMFSLMH